MVEVVFTTVSVLGPSSLYVTLTVLDLCAGVSLLTGECDIKEWKFCSFSEKLSATS